MSLGPGDRFGEHLQVEEVVGAGAFGTVYRARDTLIGRVVALKVLNDPLRGAADEPERTRILREARLIGSLSSPHVVTLYRAHLTPEGRVALEMEYMDGGSLEATLARGALQSREEILRLLNGILKGLDAAHRQGLTHRDVKPANVLLGSGGEVKLSDFGLGGRLDDAALSQTGGLGPRGTPHYMSPEAFLNEPVLPTSDLWSVGVVLYRMLAGRLPFRGTTLLAYFHAVLNEEPLPLPDGVPADLGGIALRCLAKQSHDRPSSCASLLELVGELAAARVPPLRRSAAPPRDRRPLVGRAAELAVLERPAARVEDGHGATVLVTGEGGIGKSRLLEELRLRTEARGFAWHHATLTPVGGLAQAIAEGVRRSLETEGGEDSTSRFLSSTRFGPAARLLRRLVLHGTALDLEERPQLQWALEQLFRGLSTLQPVGLLVEDAHFASGEDLKQLRAMSHRLAEARVLFVIAMRSADPEASEGAGASMQVAAELAATHGVTALEVGPLAADAVLDLLQHEAEGRAVDPAVVERVTRQSGGNPLYAIELFRHLQAEGGIVTAGDRVSPGPAWEVGGLPPRLRDLVVRRVQLLDDEERATLDAAAVDGVAFDGRAVSAVLGQEVLTTLRRLQHIYRAHGLVVPRPGGFAFSHALIQEALYRDLAPELQAELHLRLAEHLESRQDGPVVDAERMGTHWERGGEVDRARPYLRQAALEAAAHQRYLHSLELAARSGLYPPLPDAREAAASADLCFALAGSLCDLGRHAEAQALVRRVAEGSEDGSELAWRAQVWRCDVNAVARRLESADETLLQQGLVVLPSGAERARALLLLATARRRRGDLPAARALLQEQVEMCQRMRLDALQSTGLHELATLESREGNPPAAVRLFSEAAALSEAVGKDMNAAVSRIVGAMNGLALGVDPGAAHVVERAIRVIAFHGAEQTAAHAKAYLAVLRYAAGDRAGALRALDEAREVVERFEGVYSRMEVAQERGWLLVVGGQVEEGRDSLELALRLAEEAKDESMAVSALQLAAGLHLYLGDAAAAGGAAARALEMASRAPEPDALPAFAAFLAELGLWGLPDEVLERCRAHLETKQASTHPLREGLDATWRAVAAGRSARPEASILRAGARALRDPRLRVRHAERDLLATWLEADAERAAAGSDGAAASRARRGLEGARRLGHVWLELVFLGLLARAGEAAAREERNLRLGQLAARLATREARARMVAAWDLGHGAGPRVVG